MKMSTIICDICHVSGNGTWPMTLKLVFYCNRMQWFFEIEGLLKYDHFAYKLAQFTLLIKK